MENKDSARERVLKLLREHAPRRGGNGEPSAAAGPIYNFYGSGPVVVVASTQAPDSCGQGLAYVERLMRRITPPANDG